MSDFVFSGILLVIAASIAMWGTLKVTAPQSAIRKGFVVALLILCSAVGIAIIIQAADFTHTFPQGDSYKVSGLFQSVRSEQHYSYYTVGVDTVQANFILQRAGCGAGHNDSLLTPMSGGLWVGDLPKPGTKVEIVSTTGYTKDVTIRDLDTGKVYRPKPEHCKPQMKNYEVAVCDSLGNSHKSEISAYDRYQVERAVLDQLKIGEQGSFVDANDRIILFKNGSGPDASGYEREVESLTPAKIESEDTVQTEAQLYAIAAALEHRSRLKHGHKR